MERETEGREKFASPTRLFRGQQEAADRVVEALNVPGRQLIFLIGISGVGKSEIFNSILPHILQADALVLAVPNEGEWVPELQAKNLSIALPREASSIQALMNRLPDYHISLVSVAGMNEGETASYVASLNRKNATLSDEQIVKFSMGIPLLAQNLVVPGLNEQMAKRIAARYFARSIARDPYFGVDPLQAMEAAKTYLNMPLPWEAWETSLTKIRDRRIYERLSEILVRWSEMRQNRLSEASPLFVAAGSEQIYDEVLQAKRENDLTIFVPHLSEADFQRLRWELGLSLQQGYVGIGRRAEMFRVNMKRKVSFWFRDGHGRVYTHPNEYGMPLSAKEKRDLIQDAYLFRVAVEEGEYPVGSSEEQGRSFLISAHDHLYQNVNVALLGWMMESWLQQKGIAYVVENKGYGASYGFLPDRKQIVVAAAADKFAEGKRILRALPAYQRLRAKFKKLNFQDGLSGNGLNLGDLIDIMFLTYGTKGRNLPRQSLEEIGFIKDILIDRARSSVKRLVTRGYSMLQKDAPKELSRRRYHSWLNLPVDLGQLISDLEDPENPGSIGITGPEDNNLTIAQKQGSEDLYELVFSDLDEEKQYVAGIFREIGLPVRL